MQLSKLSPRRVVNFIRRHLETPEPDWFGVYRSFSEVPDENPWSKPPWVDFNAAKLQKIDRSKFGLKREGFFVPSTNVVPALLINQAPGRVRVLDFGGGTGNSYYSICRHLNDPAKVDWLVFDDNAALYDVGKAFAPTRTEPPPTFCDTLPEGPVGMVHIAGTLQYIEDYAGVLSMLAKRYHPEHFVLTRTYAGHIETFVTRQVIRGSSTPCMFLNVEELRACLVGIGYEEILCAPCNPMDATKFKDIPEQRRIRTSLDMVWKISREWRRPALLSAP